MKEKTIKKNLGDRYIGKFVICRSNNEGINAGTVVDLDATGVILENVRRLWDHAPEDKSMCWYEGVSISGLADESVVSVAVSQKLISEDYSLTLCTKLAEHSIMEHSCHAQI